MGSLHSKHKQNSTAQHTTGTGPDRLTTRNGRAIIIVMDDVSVRFGQVRFATAVVHTIVDSHVPDFEQW